ncbi:MAG: WG repeat-containing protein [Planctomycetota bacterium]
MYFIFRDQGTGFPKRQSRWRLGLIAAGLLCWSMVPSSRSDYRPLDLGSPLFGEVNEQGALKYANAGPDDDLLPFEVNGYWGLLNPSRRVIALPDLDWTDVGVEGLARATYRGKTGFILGNGRWRFDPIYPYADRFEERYAIIGDGEHFGFIDKTGKVRLAPQLDAALRFREGWAGVRIGDRCGFIDTRFRPATPLMFTAVRSFHEGFAAVRLPAAAEDELSIPDPPDELPTESEPVPADTDVEPSAPAETRVDPDMPPPPEVKPNPAAAGGVWGFINKQGRMVFRDSTGKIEALGDFNQGLARFRSGGRWGYMDKTFRVVLPPTYEGARDFTSGSAAVKLNGKWGYINRKFEVSVPFEYDRADDFDDTLAMVTLDGKVGFIGRSGRVEIEPQFTWAEPFRLGVARVAVGDSFGYIKTSGFVLYDPRSGQLGIVDITPREQLRVQASTWQRYNRKLLPPSPGRPALPAPYPPEYQYDEGLWVDSPPGLPPETRPENPDGAPGETNPDPVERV